METGGMKTHVGHLMKHVPEDFTICDLSNYGRPERYWRVWQMAADVDIVHNHATPVGLIVGKLRGKKTLETVHNVYDWLTPLERLHYRISLLFADSICAYCEEVKYFTERMFHVKNVKLFPHCVDSQPVRPGYPGLVLAVGRLVQQRRFEDIIEAFKAHSTGWLVIAGDGSLRRELTERARGEKVLFTGCIENPNDFNAGLSVVLTDKPAGTPIAALESMARGIPTVTSLQDFTEALDMLEENPKSLESYGIFQREMVRRQNSVKRFTESMTAIYATLNDIDTKGPNGH
jgi:glycosyltransferase involved in cell wall biosynthesis